MKWERMFQRNACTYRNVRSLWTASRSSEYDRKKNAKTRGNWRQTEVMMTKALLFLARLAFSTPLKHVDVKQRRRSCLFVPTRFRSYRETTLLATPPHSVTGAAWRQRRDAVSCGAVMRYSSRMIRSLSRDACGVVQSHEVIGIWVDNTWCQR